MFGLFSRTVRKAAPATTRFVRPTLESLEARDCPSAGATETISLGIVSYAANKTVTLGGQVTNTPNPGGLTVQVYINGEKWCWTTTDANGNWSVTSMAPDLGIVTAQTTDGQSNTAWAMLAVTQIPLITNFQWVAEGADWYTFSGHVNDDNYQGEVVNFGGMVASLAGKSAKVDSNGNFSLLLELDGTSDDTGTATAQAVDWWGLPSPFAATNVVQ